MNTKTLNIVNGILFFLLYDAILRMESWAEISSLVRAALFGFYD